MSTTPSPPRATDPRPARTRAAIFEAVELLAASQEEVAVNAIVRAAGISRSTFYSQFASLDHLAAAMLIDEFRQIGGTDIIDRRGDNPDTRRIARLAAAKLVEHIQQRRVFYRSALDWRTTSGVNEMLTEAFAEQIAASMSVMGDAVPSEVRADDIATYIGGGAIAMLSSWLRDDEPASESEMSSRLLAVMPRWLVGEA